MYNSVASETVSQDIGVIQGSKCGPLFFDIYSNDMNYLLPNDDKIFYADDTCLVFRGLDIATIMEGINSTLAKVADWCKFNKLALNPAKSVYMLITGKKEFNEPSIFIEADAVNRVESFCYLGMNIDEKMKYQCHVDVMRKKFSQLAGMTFRIKKYLNLGAAKKLYFAFVYSIMTYCIAAWGGVMLETASCVSVFASHTRIVRNLFSRFQHDDQCTFKSMKILKLVDVYKLSAAAYMFKVMKFDMYGSLHEGLRLEYPSHRYPTSLRADLILPFQRKNAIRISHKYQFVNIWNTVPCSIKSLNKLSTFKRKYTEHLLSLY